MTYNKIADEIETTHKYDRVIRDLQGNWKAITIDKSSGTRIFLTDTGRISLVCFGMQIMD